MRKRWVLITTHVNLLVEHCENYAEHRHSQRPILRGTMSWNSFFRSKYQPCCPSFFQRKSILSSSAASVCPYSLECKLKKHQYAFSLCGRYSPLCLHPRHNPPSTSQTSKPTIHHTHPCRRLQYARHSLPRPFGTGSAECKPHIGTVCRFEECDERDRCVLAGY